MILGLLIGFLQFAISPFGMLAFLIGLVMFIVMPMVPRVTNYFHAFSRFHLWLGANMLKRASVVVSEHGDLLLKRMSPDDIGTETIPFNDDRKEFEDQNERKAKSSWMGIPFALADEVHGFLFTPLEAALGKRKKHAEQRDEMVRKATPKERQKYGVQGWIKGVLSFPKDTYEMCNLNNVRQLVTGSERAEHPQRVDTFYDLSRDPYKDGTSVTRFIILIVALIGPFAGIWVLASQLGIGPSAASAGQAASESVSYGDGAPAGTPINATNASAAILFLLMSRLGGSGLVDRLKAVDWKRVAVSIPVLGLLPLIFGLVFLVAGPIVAIFIMVLMGMGFWMMPVLIQVLKASDKLTNSIAGLLLKSGFMGYRLPVFEYTPRGYETREFSKMDVDESSVVWHSFLGRKFGFTYTPDESVWEGALANTDDLDNRAVDTLDTNTNVPAGNNVIGEQVRAVYGEYIPNRFKRNQIYVKTGIALERMKNVACGEKSHKRLTRSKEEHGGTGGISDTKIMYGVMGCGIFSFMAGLAVFIIPTFL